MDHGRGTQVYIYDRHNQKSCHLLGRAGYCPAVLALNFTFVDTSGMFSINTRLSMEVLSHEISQYGVQYCPVRG